MCGILGTIGGSVTRSQFEGALDALLHRGPDDADIFFDPNDRVYLGHRRLSIIDLSSAGKQPFSDARGRFHLIYNGEIYNYLELREELSLRYVFRTHTDTEVLLAAYMEWGKDCLTRLNGMFAFALWDSKERTLFIARDRLGEKPLFYSQADGVFMFASEIKALRPFKTFGANEHIIGQYLYYGLYDHSDETFFDGIRSLPPGHSLLYAEGAATLSRYWDIADSVGSVDEGITEAQAKEKLHELLSDSLKLRFRSDVPVGINLSSGLDSGVLFSFAREMRGDTLHAFSMCTEEGAYDECGLIKEETLAGYDQSLWHRSVLSPDEVVSRAHDLVLGQDQPYGGIPTIAYEKMMALTKEKQVTVLLEGQGVDELLGGYRYYREELLKDQGAILPETDIHEQSQDTTKLLQRSVLNAGLRDTMSRAPLSFERPFSSHLLNAQYRDLRYTKLPRVLRFNDHASMAYGREVRQPYLDHRVVEFCFHLPHRYKIHADSQKVLMREAFQTYLKPSHRARQKVAYGAQQIEWLRIYGESWVMDILNSQSFRNRPYWDHEALERAAKAFFKGEGNNSFFLWQCVNLELWLQAFIDK